MKVSHASICVDGRLTFVRSFAYDNSQITEYGHGEGDWRSVGDVLAPIAANLVLVSWRKFAADCIFSEDKKEITMTHQPFLSHDSSLNRNSVNKPQHHFSNIDLSISLCHVLRFHRDCDNDLFKDVSQQEISLTTCLSNRLDLNRPSICVYCKLWFVWWN